MTIKKTTNKIALAGRFDAPPRFPVEVNLRAQVAIRHNVELVKTKNGKTVSERAMYILVAPDAGDDAKLAYGAVILPPSEVDLFAGWAAQRVAESGAMGSLGPILAFDGLRDHPFDTGHIMDALADQGFTAAPDFTYVDPFLKGRAAGLVIKPGDKPLDIAYTYYGAAFFVFLGILKLGLRIRRCGQGPSREAPDPSVVPMVEPQVVAAVAAPALASNDFIGALARKAASSNAAKQVQSPAAIVSMTNKGASLGGKMRKLAGFGGALALFLVFAGFGGSFNIPSVHLLKGAFGLKSGMTEITMTEAAPGLAADVMPLAVPQSAPVAVVQTHAAAVVVAPAAKPVSMADNLRDLQTKVATWISVAKVQFSPWRMAPPVWLWASLLAAVIVMPALFILPKLPALCRKAVGKSSKLDPYERLLQRRLAEIPPGQTVALCRAGLLRA